MKVYQLDLQTRKAKPFQLRYHLAVLGSGTSWRTGVLEYYEDGRVFEYLMITRGKETNGWRRQDNQTSGTISFAR
uniref:Uncharacterized protein n=1 Tax=Cucumis melo TaxID=3656 RepID=A0A9I9EC59_CUCME